MYPKRCKQQGFSLPVPQLVSESRISGCHQQYVTLDPAAFCPAPQGNASFLRLCCLVPDLWRRRESDTPELLGGEPLVTTTPPKVTLTMENQPSEDDVFSIANGELFIVMFVLGGVSAPIC